MNFKDVPLIDTWTADKSTAVVDGGWMVPRIDIRGTLYRYDMGVVSEYNNIQGECNVGVMRASKTIIVSALHL